MDRGELEGLDRESLVVRAERAGIRRARILTRPELVDELLRADPTTDRAKLEKARGFFGRARDLVARVVERGLHLPDAAERIRSIAGGPLPPTVPRNDPQAVPTVTLAEIYAAQGHKARAIETLKRVLEREPEHAAARTLLARLEDAAYVAPAPAMPPEAEVEADITADPDRPPPLAPHAREDESSPSIEPMTEPWRRGRSEESGAHLGEAFAPDEIVGGIGAETETRTGTGTGTGTFTGETLAQTAESPHAAEAAACVAVPIGPGAVYVWWRVGAIAGDFVVRAVVVVPSWDGPVRETRDIPVEPSIGGLGLRGLPERAIVRVAVGVLGDDGAFVPLAHSPALESAPRRGLVRWTLRGAEPVALEAPGSETIARAVEAARRA